MMMLRRILPPAAALAIISVLLLFRTVPSGELWSGYSVLYVPSSSSDLSVRTALAESGIEHTVCLSGQYVPAAYGASSVETAMLLANISAPEFEYLTRRNSYFFDSSSGYRLYYVPSSYRGRIPGCISRLSDMGITAGLDTSSAYPWVMPLVCAVFAALLVFLSADRRVCAAAAVIPVVYVFCAPFCTSAAAVCLLLVCIFSVSNLWRRKGAVRKLAGAGCVPVMAAAALVTSFSGPARAGFLFVLAAAGAGAVLLAAWQAGERGASGRSFVPVMIRPAGMIRMYEGKAGAVLPAAAAVLLAAVLVSVLSGSSSGKKSGGQVSLPAADAAVRAEELPDLDDYTRWLWNVGTYPYRPLSGNSAVDPDTVVFPRYESSGGMITEKDEIMRYDRQFRAAALDSVDRLPFDSIESVLKSQPGALSPGYRSSGEVGTGLFGMIMMGLSMLVPLAVYISTVTRQEKGI